MKIASTFKDSTEIPIRYTCEGDNVNPPFTFSGIPKKAQTIALIIDDPDAESKEEWIHWVVWNIPASVKTIEENSVPKGAVQGRNDFGNHKYGGPCPPQSIHNYRFKAYALDVELDLSSNARKEDLEKAMHDHIIGEALLIGIYGKKEI